MKPWKDLKISSFNNDLSKRWFVQWNHWNAEKKKYTRVKRYGGINREKTISGRLFEAKALREGIHSNFQFVYHPKHLHSPKTLYLDITTPIHLPT